MKENLVRLSCETWRCGDHEPRKRILVLIITFTYNFSLCTSHGTSPLNRGGEVADIQLVSPPQVLNVLNREKGDEGMAR